MKCRLRENAYRLASLLIIAPLAFAQNPVAEAAHRLTKLNGQLTQDIQNASPDVKKAVNDVPLVTQADLHQVAAPQNPARTIIVVSDSQKQVLISAVDKFTAEKRRQQREYSALAITFVIAGAVLALLASIFNFIKWNTVSGVVGLIVVAVVGFPNVYPVSALSDFYGSLASQAVALQTDCELKNPFTQEDYASSAGQLKILLIYEANNRPKLGTAHMSTEELAKALQTYKTSANIAAETPH
jgi:hypothetical protein